MRKLSALAFAATLLTSSAAMAQDTIMIDLSGISADLAAELNVDASDLPNSISLAANFAADVCGIEVDDLETSCVAITTSAELLTVVRASIDEGGKGNGNSAREFAPGQQDGPAKDFAPGQQDGAAKDSAPGQMKKN